MKIGILTFHSQLNYGALLQAYAMQLVYKKLGYEPVIIDRWLNPNNAVLSWHGHTLKGWIKEVLSFIYGLGIWSRYVRYLKTIRFFRKYLVLTPYHFHDWKEAPKDLGVDLISVGSDQVWNVRLFPVAPYFLKGASAEIPAITYAASIGMPSIPEEFQKLYQDGVQRFKAISVREKEGVRLLEPLGVKAQQVVDPTLLVDPNVWKRLVGGHRPKKKLVVYVLAENVWNMLPILEKFTKCNPCQVTLLVEGFEKRYGKNIIASIDYLKTRLKLLRSPVHIFASAGPVDFVREIWSASWVVANSFHALMFSIIFRRQVRVIMPHDKTRQGMHARMAEFAGTVVNGPLMQQSIENALTSIEHGEEVRFNESVLNEKIEESRQWLINALEKCKSSM